MKKLNNVIVFDTDDEMTDYCLKSTPTIKDSGDFCCYDFDFTDAYNDAVTNGLSFFVNDCKSKIMKRGCVTRGLISKPITNLGSL